MGFTEMGSENVVWINWHRIHYICTFILSGWGTSEFCCRNPHQVLKLRTLTKTRQSHSLLSTWLKT